MDIGILYAWVAYVNCIVVIIVRNRVTVLTGSAQFQKPFSRLLVFFILFTAVDGTWGIFFSKAIKSYFLLQFFTYAFHLLAALSAFVWSGYMRDFLKAHEKQKKIINTARLFILFIQLILLASNLSTHYAFNITPDCDYLPTPLRNMTFYLQFSYYLVIMFLSIFMFIVKNSDRDKRQLHLTAIFFSSIPLLFGFGQMEFPDAPFYSMGFMLTSVAIYGFNVTAEREKVLDMLHRKERNKFANIVDAFSTDYEAIYYVDLDTHAYQNLVMESDYYRNIAPKLVFKNDFFSDVVRNIEKVVHPEDRVKVFSALSKGNLLKLFHDKSSFTVTYRVIIDNADKYYQMKGVFYETENDTKKVVIGVNNIDDSVRKQQETAEIITAVGDAYESIYLVDTYDGSFISFRRSDYLEENYPDKGVLFSESFIKYILRDVHPDYRELLIKYADLNFIKNELRDKKAIGVNFYDIHTGQSQYYEMRIVKPEKYESNGKILVSFINRNEIILQRQREIFITGLSDDYDSVYHGNLKQDSFESIRLTETFKKSHPGLNNIISYSDFIKQAGKFVHPDDLDSVLSELTPENIRKKLDESKSFYINYRQMINDTVQYYRIKILRTENWKKDNEFMFGTSNVDELIRQQIEKEMEQKKMLEDAKDKAEAASRAKSTFLFNMSHDIRTPMNAIKGFTELAERHIDNREKVNEYLGKVKESSNHLLNLINDVLDMSRIESGKVIIDEVPANIRKETEKLLSMVDVSAKEKGIALYYDISGLKDSYVYVDTLHVTQIILNVLSNAIKYTKKGGSVFYTIEQLQNSDESTASYCITVRDTGIGMSPEFQQHLFEEFARESNTTKSGVEGTGLGMSIVKNLIDMMGGRIEVESEQGIGTTVRVFLTFRIADQMPHAIVVDEKSPEDSILNGKKLLLVEDNEFNREIAREILVDKGLNIEEAEDGAVAVEKVKAHSPDYYDFILMDIQMPYMDGYAATRTIRNLKNADYGRLPIIAMTANAFEEDVKNAFDAGMNGHLAKPIDIPKLIDCLKKNLNA